jgi:hypothetical protein
VATLPITEPGVFLPASVCSRLRHPLLRDLAEARRDGVVVAPEIVDAIGLIDTVGAWWDQKNTVAVATSTIDGPRCDRASWTTVSKAAEGLDITQQAVKGLLKRGTLKGEKVDGIWRVSSESVVARRSRQMPTLLNEESP